MSLISGSFAPFFARLGARRAAPLASALVVLGSIGVAAQAVSAPAQAQSAADASNLGSSAGRGAAPGVVPIPAMWTANSRTSRLPDGRMQTVFFAKPVNYRASNGSFTAIDNSLTSRPGGVVRNGANSWAATLPASAAADATVGTGATTVSFGLQGGAVASAPRTDGTTATYTDALPGVDVAYTSAGSALKETLTLRDASSPATFSYRFTVSPGTTLRAAGDGGLDVLDSAGTRAFGFDPPRVTDEAGVSGPVSMNAVPAVGGYTVTVRVDPAWLTDPARAFPVTVDPSADFGSSTQSCVEDSSHPSTSTCSTDPLKVGRDAGASATYRSMLQFNDITSVIPIGSVVNDSYLGMWVDGSSTTNTADLQVNALTHSWTTGATWNTYNGTSAWPTTGGGGTTNAAGGDYVTAPAGDYGNLVGANGSYKYTPLAGLVQQWVNRSSENDGLLFKMANESTDQVISLASPSATNSATWPVLHVDWLQNYNNSPAFTAHLDDHLGIAVDSTSGNLDISSDLLSYQGVGLGLGVGADWNSLDADGAQDLGLGWNTSLRDHGLYIDSSGAFINIGQGHTSMFVRTASGTYTTPPGANADLVDAGSGVFTLTFHSSQQVWTFNTFSTGPNSATGYRVSQKDRDGNTITYTWNTATILSDGSPALTSVTDTQGRTITVGNPAGPVTGYSDSTGRSVGFSTDGSYHTYQITDANGNPTVFTYTGNLITKITTPLGNITTISYDGSNRVQTITRVTNNTLLTGNTYTFTYNGYTATGPGGAQQANAVLADPNSHNTTYYIDALGNVQKVLDGNNNSRQTSYDANSDPLTLTDGLSQITTLSRDTNHNVTKAQAPTESGVGSGGGYSQQAGYNVAAQSGGTSIPGYQYLPSSSTDADAHQTNYTYNTKGKVATVAPPSGGGTITNHYQGDSGISCAAKPGELCSTSDARGHATSYTYDASGNLTKITPPLPLGAQTITPDTLGRDTKVIDGRSPAVTTTYGYDNMDRITYLRTDGLTASACTTTDAAAGKCLRYTYDNDGNLTARLDKSGTTGFTYDTLNRPTIKTFPDLSTSSAGYDGANNITSYTDSGGTVTYGYDPADQVTSLAEPGGSCTGTISLCTTFHYTSAGLRDKTTYPSGETENVTYDNAGRDILMTAKRPAGTVFIQHGYAYQTGTAGSMVDHAVLQKDTPLTGTATSYVYDNLNRLTSSSGGVASSYTYDATGNRLTSVTGGVTRYWGYNNANELCWWGGYTGTQGTTTCPATPTNDFTDTHDGTGNELSASGRTTTWNALNQMSADANPTTTSYTYADVGQNELLSTTTSGTTTTLLNALHLGITAQTAGTATTRFVRDPAGNLVAMLTSTGAHEYYLTDRLGSTLALSNATGTAEDATYTYDPYGTTTNTGTLATTNPFRYTGGYQHPTSLYHLGQREYNPGAGAWTQQDPLSQINDPTQANRYPYTGNNPINNTDPTGLCGDFSPASAS